MSKKLSVLALFLLIVTYAFSQTGKITGKVLNEKNEPVAGVSVKIVGAPGGVTTDVEGRFSLNLSTGKKYELEFSAVGYSSKSIAEVEVVAGQTNELNVTLEVASKNLSTVTVTATRSSARKETTASLIQFQKNTNTVASVISAESIRRSPDRNTGEVLKRTPGVSVQDGRFIVVRGLADRYNQALLNGILLGSAEPDRKTFSFDLIPAAMIDNIIINKAFVPEYPGEWAGGLIQVNTKDIPSNDFFNIQIGTGFNSQTVGKKFYRDEGGKWDWLGFDDGSRALPPSYTTKSEFDNSTRAAKSEIGKQMRNAWAPEEISVPLNINFEANGGFNGQLFGKKAGGTFGIVYNKTNRFLELENRQNSLSNGIFSVNTDFHDDRYAQEVSAGAFGSLSFQLNSLNKVSFKSLLNVNSTKAVTLRNGIDRARFDSDMKGSELLFKENTLFNVQAIGEHGIASNLKLKWYGSFNILDGYIPDQRRILYSRVTPQDPYRLIISNTLSQQSGSRIYQSLSDYIYTGGADLSYGFDLFDQKQTVKGGYMLQIKDRLYDAQLFANFLPSDNDALKQLGPDVVFAQENFGDGTGNKFGFDAIKGNTFRYLANTILNAGYIQLDNQFSPIVRVVWGVRVEDYDQLVGSVKASDPRHTHSQVRDWLPGVNATFKLNSRTNLRVSGSQTVIRPEFRELSFLNLYDFELNASVQGKPDLKRTKVTNADLRYEFYPRGGEVLTLGFFYKFFENPIEQVFNEGSGGASTFTFQNPDEARSYGIEAEFRKKLDFSGALKNFTFQANAAYIYSRIKDSALNIDRPLQGQSPYLINVGLLYDLEKQGFNATLLFNMIGERIYLVGDISSGAGSPDIYEAPRPVLDFQLAKKIMKKRAEIKLNIADILNQRQYFYQNADPNNNTDFQKNKDAYRFTRRFGTTFGIRFSYTIL